MVFVARPGAGWGNMESVFRYSESHKSMPSIFVVALLLRLGRPEAALRRPAATDLAPIIGRGWRNPKARGMLG